MLRKILAFIVSVAFAISSSFCVLANAAPIGARGNRQQQDEQKKKEEEKKKEQRPARQQKPQAQQPQNKPQRQKPQQKPKEQQPANRPQQGQKAPAQQQKPQPPRQGGLQKEREKQQPPKNEGGRQSPRQNGQQARREENRQQPGRPQQRMDKQPRPGEFRHKQIRHDPRRRVGTPVRHRPNYVRRHFRYGARPPQQKVIIVKIRREPLFLSALRILSTFFVGDNSFRPHRVSYSDGGYDEINLSPVGRGYYDDVPIDAYVDEYGFMYMETSDDYGEPLFSAIINNETDEQMTYDEFMEEIE